MNRIINAAIASIIIMSLLVGCSLSVKQQNLPSSVLTKYQELEEEFKAYVGASIEQCVKSGEKVYLVDGSGGYSGITFYYHENGTEIGSYGWDDVILVDEYENGTQIIDPSEPPPPVNIQEYECTVIKRSW